MFRLLIDNKDYTKYILDNPEISGQFIEDTLIGNTPSLCLNITLDNYDKIFDSLLSKPFVVKDEDVLLGTFYVVVAPERMTDEINAELYDSMRFTDVRYISSLQYPCKLKDQLDEMAYIVGVAIDYSEIPVVTLQRDINFWDNTLSIRSHLSMIAESTACNVYSLSNGTIKFVKLKKGVSCHITEYDVEQFDKESFELYYISKVRFDDSVTVIEKGNDASNTLYLTQDNMYIDSQETVDYIYSIVGGLSVYSACDLRIASVDSAKLGDIIEFDGYFKFIMLNYKITYLNGSYNIQEINGSIKTKNLESMQAEIGEVTKIKRLKVITDQNEAKLEILAKEQDGLNEKYSNLKIDVDGISLKAEEVLGTMYKMETGRGNIFDNCQQLISKDINDSTTKSLSIMPLGVNKNDIVGKDICIAVDVWAKNAIPRTLAGYMGAYFTVTYEDGTVKKYSTIFVPGIRHFQYTLATHTVSLYQRIFTHYKIEDKPVKSVSNLTIEIACNGELLKASNPKVEYGTYPTGFEFDQKAIRDNITNINKQYASIEINLAELKLQSVSMTEEITTINGNVSTLTARLNSTELKLTPTAITAAVNEKIGVDGQLRTTKFVLDKNGGHFYGGGLDISNNSNEKVLYADTNGNLTIKNLNAVNGNFSGTITGGSILGNTTINVGTDLYVGNNVYLGNTNDFKKSISFNDNSYIDFLNFMLSAKVKSSSLTLSNSNGLSYAVGASLSTDGVIVLEAYQNIYNRSYIYMGATSASPNTNRLSLSSTGGIYSNKAIEISSDLRLKKNICSVNFSEIIDEIEVFSFEYTCGGGLQSGVIAQKLLNSNYKNYLVSTDQDGYYAVNYNVINMALVQKVQNMDKTIKQMSGKLAELEGRALYAQSN